MRGTRWLLLVAIVVIVGGIAATYRAQRRALQQQAPPKPNALPLDLNSSAEEWHWEQTEGKPPFRKTVEIKAKNFKQIKDTSRIDLERIELKLYHKHDPAYDLVKSANASFFANEKRLYSPGEVEITLGVPTDEPPRHRLVSIRSTGVNFDSATGRSETDQPAFFVFENGDGKSKGAAYDPTSHQLEMKSQVEIHWKAPTPNAKPMKIESDGLTYLESKSEIWLRPWGRVTRDNSVIEGQGPLVHLQDGAIRLVEASQAHGVNQYPNRKVEYEAERLWVDFNDSGEVSRVLGETGAKLVSDAEASRTTVTASRVEMTFADTGEESVLSKVASSGNSVLESRPKPLPGRTLPETHVLRSEAIDLEMREGGKEIARVATRTPGNLEFQPNLPPQHHRVLDGKRIVIAYGAQNQIESFHATEAKTRTDPTVDERNRAAAVTSSSELLAKFEPKGNRLATMEQWGDFTYDEGDRRARAAKATLDSGQNIIHLEKAARMWDTSGSTAADVIRMDQRSGDYTAEGHVNSSRLPEQGNKKSSEMLSGDEPLQAQAQRMDSSNHNRRIRYRGKVTMWQGANRIQADAIDVDREKRMLVANGNVISQLWEQPKEDDESEKKAPANPVLTVVRAPHMVYTEENRLAWYSGGVRLTRPGLDVRGQELRAWLAESGADSSLDHAFAEGKVQIVQTGPDRTRTGIGEHGEYYTADQKIILRGGQPSLLDSKKGRTRGDELTYYANDDRLLVNGAPDRPANSVLRKK